MIRAGDLNRRIKIQVRQAGQDALGQPGTAGWMDLDPAPGEVWASILFLNGKEYAVSSAELSRAQVSMRIRYRTDVTAAMRVLHGGAVYNIEAVLPDAAGHEYVDLACSVGTNNG